MSQVYTVVSFTRFCEWVQGKKVRSETDVGTSHPRTVLVFEDGSRAIMRSGFDMRFGERTIEPPQVAIEEKSP